MTMTKIPGGKSTVTPYVMVKAAARFLDPSTLGEVFADPAELAKMRAAQESFADEMRSRR
ncbi:hypothetical protein AB0F43_21425 [Kribbella sp. NPDC023972]|uniref:hypothetical protein n=1 Tax=Kribbella sp. NPDC023972 TaxID=3154795 RepID=UPI0033FBF8F6